MDFFTVIISIGTSLIASFIFWFMSFAITGAKVVFSDCIEKTKLQNEEGYRYRIRVMNCGTRDLIEVVFVAKVVIRQEKQRSTYLEIGGGTTRPILKGKDRHKPKIYSTYIPELEINETTLREFRKDLYSQSIKDKASRKCLTIDDLFDEFGDSISIEIYVFGCDAITGARKMFVSNIYHTLEEGCFVAWTGSTKWYHRFFFPMKRAKEAISRIEKND